MENVGRTRTAGERTLLHNPIVQDFVPPSSWTEDSNGYYLVVDLPGFKKEEVKLQVDTSSGQITVSGGRLTNDNKYLVRFEQMFTQPPNSDIDRISGKFDSEILYVTLPKQPKKEEMKQPVPEAEAHQSHHFHGSDENVVNKDEVKPNDDGHANQAENKDKGSWVESFDEDFVRKWGQEPSMFEKAIKILKRNKGIVITALLAFSLGVLVSRKFGSDEHDDDDGAV